MTIDLTKTYKTRDGQAVTELHRLEYPEGDYTIAGTVTDSFGISCRETWTDAGLFLSDEPDSDLNLVLADAQPATGLITPDPLRLEYGAFVSAVKVNFAAGTFATATPEEFDAWLQSPTPSLAR